MPKVLVGGLVAEHEHRVKGGEPAHEPDGQKRVGRHEERGLAVARGGGPVPARFTRAQAEERQADAHDPEAEQRGGGDKAQEVAVVAPADAGAHPGAVVVEPRDAVVAHGAVRAARRAVVRAGRAKLGGHAVAIHLKLPRRRVVGALLRV